MKRKKYEYKKEKEEEACIIRQGNELVLPAARE